MNFEGCGGVLKAINSNNNPTNLMTFASSDEKGRVVDWTRIISAPWVVGSCVPATNCDYFGKRWLVIIFQNVDISLK